jgi:hypothetical protein
LGGAQWGHFSEDIAEVPGGEAQCDYSAFDGAHFLQSGLSLGIDFFADVHVELCEYAAFFCGGVHNWNNYNKIDWD